MSPHSQSLEEYPGSDPLPGSSLRSGVGNMTAANNSEDEDNVGRKFHHNDEQLLFAAVERAQIAYFVGVMSNCN